MKRTLFILSLLISYGALFSQSDGYQVIAKNGLIVRNAPNRSAERIAKLPYLSEVEIIEVTKNQSEIKDGRSLKTGNWVKVLFDLENEQGRKGYVFDAYLKRKDEFTLIIPDTARLKEAMYAPEYAGSLAYIYLKTYYEKDSPQEPLEYLEGNSDKVCSFNQEFQGKLSYYLWDCKENGANESIIFPKMELQEVKEWVEALFYDKENTWTTDFTYEPDGVGCYYEIKQSATHTQIAISCGC